MRPPLSDDESAAASDHVTSSSLQPPCSQPLRPQGYITSHASFGQTSYENEVDVSATLSVPQGAHIVLKFDAFHTEGCCDRLTVYSEQGGRLLANYSGDLSGELPILMGDDESIFYHWHSDASVANSGWRFKYYALYF